MINRHNYEEFFLLYVDKELDADSEAAVENFVTQNPDLAKELEMLQQATLAEDNIQFAYKDLLYKKEPSISLADYEEYFLLYADNELNEKQAADVENFVLKHPQLQNEFSLLQQTRLQPESIAFVGKEKLYRKEKKERRMIPLTLIRMGAAAAIVGIVYISFITINKNGSSDKRVVITASPQPTKTTIEKNETDTVHQSVKENSLASLHSTKESISKVKSVVANTALSQKGDKEKLKEIKNHEEQVSADYTKRKSKIEIAGQNIPTEETTIQEPEPAGASTEIKNVNGKSSLGLLNDDTNNLLISDPIIKEERLLAAQAVYLETDNVEEEKSIYIGAAEINKNKLKGLFKKATAFFDKKIRRNDNNDN